MGYFQAPAGRTEPSAAKAASLGAAHGAAEAAPLQNRACREPECRCFRRLLRFGVDLEADAAGIVVDIAGEGAPAFAIDLVFGSGIIAMRVEAQVDVVDGGAGDDVPEVEAGEVDDDDVVSATAVFPAALARPAQGVRRALQSCAYRCANFCNIAASWRCKPSLFSKAYGTPIASPCEITWLTWGPARSQPAHKPPHEPFLSSTLANEGTNGITTFRPIGNPHHGGLTAPF